MDQLNLFLVGVYTEPNLDVMYTKLASAAVIIAMCLFLKYKSRPQMNPQD